MYIRAFYSSLQLGYTVYRDLQRSVIVVSVFKVTELPFEAILARDAISV